MNDNNELVEVRMIDHGNCYLEKNPGEGAPIGNQGYWGKYKISNEAFEPEILEFIRDNLTEAKLDAFVRSIGARDKFWTINMDQLQRDRLQILRNAVLKGEIQTSTELAKLHTSKDMAPYIRASNREAVDVSTDVGDFAVLDIK
jgi:hypothetical protein